MWATVDFLDGTTVSQPMAEKTISLRCPGPKLLKKWYMLEISPASCEKAPPFYHIKLCMHADACADDCNYRGSNILLDQWLGKQALQCKSGEKIASLAVWCLSYPSPFPAPVFYNCCGYANKRCMHCRLCSSCIFVPHCIQGSVNTSSQQSATGKIGKIIHG